MKKPSSVVLVGFVACLALASVVRADKVGYVYDISQSQGKWKCYYVDITSKTTQVKVETYGGWGDVDLFVRYNTKPTSFTFWENSVQAGNAEVIKEDNPPAGRLYIRLFARQTFGGVTLKVKRTLRPIPTAMQTEMLNRVNFERSQQGVAAVTLNTPLRNAAQIHAADMAALDFMDHTGSDGSDPALRMDRQGYFTGYGSWGWGENVAVGQSSVAAVMTTWMGSSGHRANILNPDFHDFGCGYGYNGTTTYQHYWCQTFGYRH